MHSCDDCGILVENAHDLQTHVKHWCSRSSKRTTESDDEEGGPLKRVKYDRVVSRDIDASIHGENEEDLVFAKFAEMARGNNEKEWQERRDKYINNGLSQSTAESKADSKLQGDDMIEFMEEYGVQVLNMLRLRYGRLHNEIMEAVDGYIGDDIDRKRAIRTVQRKHRSEFEEYLSSLDSDRNEDEEEDEDTDDDREDETDADDEEET